MTAMAVVLMNLQRVVQFVLIGKNKVIMIIKSKRMKKIILFVLVIFLFVSCDNKGINVPTSNSIDEIKVEKLFVADGITVYRFYDGGRVVYFTNKKGEVKTLHNKYNHATKTTKTKVVETLCNEE